MFIVLGIMQFSIKPIFFHSDICIRLGWLWFEVSLNFMSYSQMMHKAADGSVLWKE